MAGTYAVNILFFVVILRLFAPTTSSAVDIRAATHACVVAAGGRTFDLSELAAPALRHVSREPDSHGWVYSFSACGDVPERFAGAVCAAAPRAAALQETVGKCYALGASATRTVAATPSGVMVNFSGGEGGRSSIISIECADLPRPHVVRWSHGAAPGAYVALVRARAGCALECARNAATGAVCGGATHGTCVAAGNGDTGNRECQCVQGRFGPACTFNTHLVPGNEKPAVETTWYALLISGFPLLSLIMLFCMPCLLFHKRISREHLVRVLFFVSGTTVGILMSSTKNIVSSALLQLPSSSPVFGSNGTQALAPIAVFGYRSDLGSMLQLEFPHGKGIELGVQAGFFAKSTLSGWTSCASYVLVDTWAPLENYFDASNVPQEKQDAIFQEAIQNTAFWGDVISICRNFTTNCAPRFADASFDFVYVDARHDRQGVTEDLTTWWPKTRPGGLLCGHDFVSQSEGPAQQGERWCVPQHHDCSCTSPFSETYLASLDFAGILTQMVQLTQLVEHRGRQLRTSQQSNNGKSKFRIRKRDSGRGAFDDSDLCVNLMRKTLRCITQTAENNIQ